MVLAKYFYTRFHQHISCLESVFVPSLGKICGLVRKQLFPKDVTIVTSLSKQNSCSKYVYIHHFQAQHKNWGVGWGLEWGVGPSPHFPASLSTKGSWMKQWGDEVFPSNNRLKIWNSPILFLYLQSKCNMVVWIHHRPISISFVRISWNCKSVSASPLCACSDRWPEAISTKVVI